VPVVAAPAYPLAFAGAGAITFAADQADLVGPSAAAVARVANLLGGGTGPRVTVTGFAADTPGPADVAQRLSERRAQVVVDALVAAGVRRERLVAVGRGAAAPLATPAQSRRVEFSAE
jgi:outer membrane protein OmpA-like peptidoglycan-associated protein